MKTEIKDITPVMAKEMLRRNTSNRKLNQSHVIFLASEMSNGHWLFDGQPIRRTTAGGLLDGQHRLEAVVLSETTQKFVIIDGIKSEAFKVMDTGKMRNATDAFGVEGIPKATIAAGATRIIMRHTAGKSSKESGSNKYSNTELLNYYKAHPNIKDFVKASQPLYKEFEKVLSQSSIAGFSYLMGQFNVTQSEEFWSKVCTGNNISAGCPAGVLRKRLIADKLATTSMSYSMRTAVIFKAWNHYRKNATIKYLKWVVGDKFPKLI